MSQNRELQEDVLFFSKLPVDVWDEIFQYLNPLDIFCKVVNVCKNWRFNLLNFYLKNYLNNNLNFLNILNIDTFINELINNEELFTKLKKYLFNQQVNNLTIHLQQKQLITENNIYLSKESSIQRYLNDLSNYFYLINHNKYFIIEDEHNSENKPINDNINNNNITPTTTSCFGTVTTSLNNKNNYNNNTNLNVNNNNNTENKIGLSSKYNSHVSKGDTNNLINFKSVLVGFCGVGKTCFVQASTDKIFNVNMEVQLVLLLQLNNMHLRSLI
ncbi:hypothetical protein ABK040_016115 [Willaertia magna]